MKVRLKFLLSTEIEIPEEFQKENDNDIEKIKYAVILRAASRDFNESLKKAVGADWVVLNFFDIKVEENDS